MSPLRQLRPLIRAGDVSEKVGGVVGQSLKLQLLDTDNFPDHRLLDLRQFVCWHDVHLIPEVLAGEIGGGELHRLGQIRCAGPIGKPSFTARRAGTRDHGDHHRLAHGESGAHLNFAVTGDRPVDLSGHIQLTGQTEQRRHRTGGNRRDLYRDFGVLLVAVQNFIHAAQMSENANRGLAFFTEGLDDAVVADAVRVIGLKGCH